MQQSSRSPCHAPRCTAFSAKRELCAIASGGGKPYFYQFSFLPQDWIDSKIYGAFVSAKRIVLSLQTCSGVAHTAEIYFVFGERNRLQLSFLNSVL